MPVHCGSQSEQDLLSIQQGEESTTPSVLDQIKLMQGNMSQMLQKAEQEEEGWKNQIASLEAQINSLLQEKGMLEAKVEGLYDALYTEQQNTQSLEQENGTLEHSLNDMQENVISLQKENSTLVAKVQNMDTTVQVLEQTLYETQENTNSLKEENGTLVAKVQNMDTTVQVLEQTLYETQENINSLKEENGTLVAKVESTDTEVQNLQQTLYERQETINSLQQDNCTLEEQVRELEETKWMHIQQINYFKISKEDLQNTLYSSSYQMRCRFQPETNGRALIINNTRFTTSEMSERTTAEGDPQKLAEAFLSQEVNIDVKTHQNLDLSTMLYVLQDEANRDHSGEDFFSCCIMTHGTQGKVFAADGFSAELLDILSLFNGSRCPSLMGKPKLFFIQACQGDKDQTVEIAGAHSDANDSPSPILAYLSTEADFFLALATVPGYVAYRREGGADFVNVLANVLKEDGKSQDLMSMMATVSRELNERYMYSPFCSTTLRHKMFFNWILL
ncbi:caspase-8-like [Branchiostoma lanceolatum]|uniref:caspase-8-like n=1 Tax=Branchiostoma lanceolatum TaxID=7740 RepID=UPI003454CBC5